MRDRGLGGCQVSEVPTWRLFAFMDDDEEGRQDETRVIGEWQVDDVVRWCRHRGYDHIYLTRSDSTRFAKQPPSGCVVHLFRGETHGAHQQGPDPERAA